MQVEGEACEPARQSRVAIQTLCVENGGPLNVLPAAVGEIGHLPRATKQTQINSDASVLLLKEERLCISVFP